MWRRSTYCGFHFVPRFLYKEIPAEPHGRDLETLPEPAESTYSQISAAHIGLWAPVSSHDNYNPNLLVPSCKLSPTTSRAPSSEPQIREAAICTHALHTALHDCPWPLGRTQLAGYPEDSSRVRNGALHGNSVLGPQAVPWHSETMSPEQHQQCPGFPSSLTALEAIVQ